MNLTRSRRSSSLSMKIEKRKNVRGQRTLSRLETNRLRESLQDRTRKKRTHTALQLEADCRYAATPTLG